MLDLLPILHGCSERVDGTETGLVPSNLLLFRSLSENRENGRLESEEGQEGKAPGDWKYEDNDFVVGFLCISIISSPEQCC